MARDRTIDFSVRHEGSHYCVTYMNGRRALALAVLCGALHASAVECAPPEGATAGSVAVKSPQERLDFLTRLFSAESDAAKLYTGVFGGGFAALTALSLGVAHLMPESDRPDMYWSAVNSAIGTAFILLGPPEVMYGGPQFVQRVALAPADDTCALLAEGERLLREGAEGETFSRSWLMHVGNAALGVGMLLLLGLGYGHWESGAINGAVGIAIGELSLLTSPHQLISGWDRYVKGPAPSAVTVHLVPTAGPGVGVLVRF